VQSWTGPGANLPVTPEQIHQVLGSAAVQQWAAKLGVNPQLLAQKLAEILPQAVSQMAPAAAAAKT
jgi:uncharacterized protein YidB (DUF937 family)